MGYLWKQGFSREPIQSKSPGNGAIDVWGEFETVRFCVDPVRGERNTANNCKAYSALSSVAPAGVSGAESEVEALRAFEQRHRILRQPERAQMALAHARAGTAGD